MHFAREGGHVSIVYLNEDEDALETRSLVEAEGAICLLLQGDIGDETFCRQVVEKTAEVFGRINILVNNAGEQMPRKEIIDVSEEQLRRTFSTNLFSFFYFAKAVLPYMKSGDSILNTTSVTAYHGSPRCSIILRRREQ